jgi:hypothetical protein
MDKKILSFLFTTSNGDSFSIVCNFNGCAFIESKYNTDSRIMISQCGLRLLWSFFITSSVISSVINLEKKNGRRYCYLSFLLCRLSSHEVFDNDNAENQFWWKPFDSVDGI